MIHKNERSFTLICNDSDSSFSGIALHCIFFWKSFNKIRKLHKAVGAGVKVRFCTFDILTGRADIDIAVIILIFIPGNFQKLVNIPQLVGI